MSTTLTSDGGRVITEADSRAVLAYKDHSRASKPNLDNRRT
jgi:hypothetical protein